MALGKLIKIVKFLQGVIFCICSCYLGMQSLNDDQAFTTICLALKVLKTELA